VIEEFNAPPVAIFTDDFEGGLGDWTIGSDGDAGTAWELGSPTNVGPAVAHSPSNCFGTNLSSNYLVDANVWLRSPVLDLTGVGGATLNYYQFLDIEEGFDFGEVAVLDAADNSQLAVIASPIDGLTTDWEQVSKSIPAAALGRNVKIEFRFTSDDIENFAGWYVDDVTVTVP
jgi:bacillopeptidase F